MRNLEHYLNLFASSETVGRELVARAIYASIYGDAEDPDLDTLRDIARSLPQTLSSEDAIRMACSDDCWRGLLAEDPIPPWALRLAIQAAGMTQAELAEKIGVNARTVRRYLAGEIPLSGSAAVAARMILTTP